MCFCVVFFLLCFETSIKGRIGRFLIINKNKLMLLKWDKSGSTMQIKVNKGNNSTRLERKLKLNAVVIRNKYGTDFDAFFLLLFVVWI